MPSFVIAFNAFSKLSSLHALIFSVFMNSMLVCVFMNPMLAPPTALHAFNDYKCRSAECVANCLREGVRPLSSTPQAQAWLLGLSAFCMVSCNEVKIPHCSSSHFSPQIIALTHACLVQFLHRVLCTSHLPLSVCAHSALVCAISSAHLLVITTLRCMGFQRGRHLNHISAF